MEVFEPSRYHSFSYDDHRVTRSGLVECHYSLRGESTVRFVERFEVGELTDSEWTGPRGEVLRRLARLLWLAAGTSYYKAAAPPEVVVAADLSAVEHAWLEGLYREGLGEFAYENGIDLSTVPRLPPPTAGERLPVRLELPRRTLVPVGGGKDSCVTVDVLEATGDDLVLFNVGGSRAARDTARVAGRGLVVASRVLDPALARLNAAGALNGHVPVTAIVSLVALMVAVVAGADRVAFSNERSASVPNLYAHGLPVNHQYSKGLQHERLLRAVLAEVTPDLGYFSALRPLSELAIARLFAASGRFMSVFTSCNAAFRLDVSRRTERWCGHCPKCRFVFLALAPFTDREVLVGTFSGDLLSDPSQLGGYRELVGLVGHKPFECVGEVEESRVALHLLATRPEWARSQVPLLVSELAAAGLAASDPDVPVSLSLAGEHHLPPDVLSALEAALEGSR